MGRLSQAGERAREERGRPRPSAWQSLLPTPPIYALRSPSLSSRRRRIFAGSKSKYAETRYEYRDFLFHCIVFAFCIGCALPAWPQTALPRKQTSFSTLSSISRDISPSFRRLPLHKYNTDVLGQTASAMAARDQAIFLETVIGLQRALKRRSYGEFCSRVLSFAERQGRGQVLT